MKELIDGSGQLIIVVLTILATELKNKILSWHKNRKNDKQDLSVLLYKKNEIENYCVKIQDQTNCSHVGVWRFHNGNTYLNGDSIKKMSLYTECAYPQELLMEEALQVELENYSRTLKDLLDAEGKWLLVEKGFASDWHMNRFMSTRGYQNMIWVLLKDPSKRPVGLLAISYLQGINYKNIDSKKIALYKQDLEFKLEGKFAI